MKKSLALLALLSASICATAQTSTRPRITGIDHVSFYTTQLDGVRALYGKTLGLAAAAPIESGESMRYFVGKQWVGYSAAPDSKANNRMDHVAFATDNASELRQYLIANGVQAAAIEQHSDHSVSFMVSDPESNKIEFVERSKSDQAPSPLEPAVSRHMIHVGFLVHSRDAEDRFYRELLGFRLYWHGGMDPEKNDWVAMQVPDGTDWLEYMLSWSPNPPDLREMGVLNHISLGVADMKRAQAILESHGWKAHDSEKAQMGKDGKWQLNVFDPDFTRIELMEFKPTQKPCCAEFTGPHPTD